ncbi:16S rRNA (guanine(966)-N(2))-methyltransferase RsmD, partial [candidate division KSB3 bacterium]|nr:16S rRNA (guanine(966)-N(2))-methyltransferase RsmD [candidate division KSB3 bacterium]MBD3327112.1 16S rRNA (guanine(966)-N(2))-methyltransferase RsmD [candidate division KSB3 bacterium]
ADQVKETLFNMLAPEITQAQVLDLFAGTGNVGIESLSRGAKHVVFVEKRPAHVRVITRNLAACGVKDRSRVYCGDANNVVCALHKAGWRFDLIFLDPPYRQTHLLQDMLSKIEALALCAETGLVVIEHGHMFTPLEQVGRFILTKHRSIGDTCLTFYRPDSEKE